MTWIAPILKISLALTLGPMEVAVNPGGDYFIYDLPEQVFEADMTVGVMLFEHWAIEGQTIIDAVPPWVTDGIYFSPYQADFWFRTYVEFGPVQVGVEHLCLHPILPGGYSTTQKYGGQNTVYLNYELDTRKFINERNRR